MEKFKIKNNIAVTDKDCFGYVEDLMEKLGVENYNLTVDTASAKCIIIDSCDNDWGYSGVRPVHSSSEVKVFHIYTYSDPLIIINPNNDIDKWFLEYKLGLYEDENIEYLDILYPISHKNLSTDNQEVSTNSVRGEYSTLTGIQKFDRYNITCGKSSTVKWCTHIDKLCAPVDWGTRYAELLGEPTDWEAKYTELLGEHIELKRKLLELGEDGDKN